MCSPTEKHADSVEVAKAVRSEATHNQWPDHNVADHGPCSLSVSPFYQASWRVLQATETLVATAWVDHEHTPEY